MFLKFPKNFFWGASTASHQVEGNTANNWSEWEKENALSLSNRASEYYSWMQNKDEIIKKANKPENYISGKSVEHYDRYKEDIQLMKDLSLNAYRFSIEWSRIEPQKGNFIESEILHYKEMIKFMKSHGITPFVTLWHWTHPIWLEQEGGVLSRDFAKYFKRYVEKLLTYLGDDVKYWITINEPDVYSTNSFGTGEWPPGIKSKLKALQSLTNLANVHNDTYSIIKKSYPSSMVSFAKHNSAIVRGDKGIVTSIVTKISKMFANDFWLYLTKKHFDYIGLNNYTRTRFIGLKVQNENKKVSDLGWELYPNSIYQCLIELKKYNVPVIITENGLADSKDEHREWYIKEVVKGMYKAIKEGVDLRGYLHWSLLDNFEWAHGFWPEFGLIHVNRKDQKRTIRKSAKQYGKIASENGIEDNE